MCAYNPMTGKLETGASLRSQQDGWAVERLVTKPDNLIDPRSHMGEGKNQFPQVVLWLPYVCYGRYIHAHMYAMAGIHMYTCMLWQVYTCTHVCYGRYTHMYAMAGMHTRTRMLWQVYTCTHINVKKKERKKQNKPTNHCGQLWGRTPKVDFWPPHKHTQNI